MRFTPKTDEEINAENMLAPGIYSFEVINAENKVSKKDNEMIVLSLQIFDHDGNHAQRINDYLLESMAFKLKHAAEACGFGDQYKSGDLQAEWFVGKTGQVRVGVEPAKDNYPARNSIKDYIVKKDGEPDTPMVASGKTPSADLGDAIPF